MEKLMVDISKAGTVELNGAAAAEANTLLHTGKGEGAEFLGWVALPSSIGAGELDALREAARRLRDKAEVIVSVGIGGSYLGAKAVIEALSNGFAPRRVLFAGQNLSEEYMRELLDALADREFAVVVISKSGTTTEPAVAFRLLREELERRHGRAGAAERIVAVTDRARGALKTMATQQGWPTFVIPDDVGGRYSVFTPAGLLPIACAGIDVGELVRGARDMEAATGEGVPLAENPAAIYAAARNALYKSGFTVEILATYEPKLKYVAEWWKQLFGESEGKQGRGIFPASVGYTADLHSMGQYIQDGERVLFETVVSVARTASEVVVAHDGDDLDGLNFVAGRRLSDINRMAELGVALAHVDGGVPNIRITLPALTPYHIGALLYFFEKACGISGYMLGVNPFDQPGVEDYKRNMFALLGKPGYEKEAAELRKKL
jgi:glucose-6-phosphate isomerase